MIAKWIIKAIVQKGISFLPASHKINYFFQKNVTGGVHLTDEHFGLKLGHARDHLGYLMETAEKKKERMILELGTGWYPVIPILFYLSSSGSVISVDIQQWMNIRTQLDTIRKFKEWQERGLLDDLKDVINEERWGRLLDLRANPGNIKKEELDRIIGLRPIVGDAGNLPMDDNSMDFICSNNTFEHIPRKVLKNILVEFQRVLHPEGLMSHFIDMSDHFAHFDKHITIYNFLKFSSRTWKKIDNTIQPQNRMRYRDYLKLYRETGIPVSHEEIREGSLEDLKRVKVHPEYSSYCAEELAISHAYIISGI